MRKEDQMEIPGEESLLKESTSDGRKDMEKKADSFGNIEHIEENVEENVDGSVDAVGEVCNRDHPSELCVRSLRGRVRVTWRHRCAYGVFATGSATEWETTCPKASGMILC